MATKAELAEVGKQQAGLVVNNALINGLCAQLAEKVKYGMTFPKDYNYQNQLLGAYLTLKETKDKNGKCVLESCSQVSVANALMTMVSSGLSMQDKQCYAVAYGGQLQLMPSVYGNTCVARRYGMKDISAMCIYKNDKLTYHIEDAEIVIDEHLQDFMNIDTDQIVGAYAIAKMADGSKHVELMNMAQIKKAWAQGYGYKEGGSGTHQKFTDQMALKTVKNRCLKYIIRTHGTEEMNDFYDNSESVEQTDRVAADVDYEVSQNANAVEFPMNPVEEPVVVAEEKKPAKQQNKVPEKVEAEIVTDDIDLPDFMRA